MEYEQLFQEWINKNPLKQYKQSKNISYSILAAMLNTSQITVKRWENGENIPRDWNRLKRLLGDDIESKWKEWLDQKPLL